MKSQTNNKKQSHFAKATRDKIKKLPDQPGVYFFKKRGRILYIGKATSLRDRVRSYFSGNMMESRGPLIVKMLGDFTSIDFIKTDSVLEALILEAKLIKKHQPEANIKDKDNKSFNYVVITKEDFPRVLIIREREITHPNPSLTTREGQEPGKSEVAQGAAFAAENVAKTFGPFTNGYQLREAMKIVRRMFPWRGKNCFPPEPHPASSHPPLDQGRENPQTRISRVPSPAQGEGDAKRGVRAGRPCFERQIGLCPGVCTGEISKKDYAKQIRKIVLFFEGDKKKLIKSLEKEMKQLAKKREFEKADKIKKQIFALYHIQDVSLIKNDPVKEIGPAQFRHGANPFRIESYDIAHLAETNRVGVMTVVEDGEAKRSDYRKFKIRTAQMGDVPALAEVLTRRLRHSEWPLPNLIVVDGGISQKNAMEKVLIERSLDIPVVSVVKDEHHRPKEILNSNIEIQNKLKISNSKLKSDILLSNAEAHRFAIAFHRHRRGKFLE